MKILSLILPLYSLFCYDQAEKFPIHFIIGKYSYEMTLQKKYNHDDDMMVTYFVVNRKGQKSNQISSHKTAEHNGKNVIVGSYNITKSCIEFKELYAERSIDSMIKRFYPDKNGDLILTEYSEYKDGIGKRIKL